MPGKANYSDIMDERLSHYADPPRLLLHVCCAPCASSVIETLRDRARLTLFFYNPNIYPEEEYIRRRDEVYRLVERARGGLTVSCGSYCPDVFESAARGYETCPEGGGRCGECFRLRLTETARHAAEGRYDAFTTTLTVSPHKDARLINEIGGEVSRSVGVPFLPCDFKKRDGYARSVELSRRYGLYRQNYCGCRFSLRD